jgi:hypothetical protein
LLNPDRHSGHLERTSPSSNHDFFLLNLPFWDYVGLSGSTDPSKSGDPHLKKVQETNVTDPLLFATDPDQYTGFWIRIRIYPVLPVSGFQDAKKINTLFRLSFFAF